MIALLVIDDGREDYLERCLASIEEFVPPHDITERIVVDDSEHALGFAGAIQEGWDRVLATKASLVFHVESDFTFNVPVPLRHMRDVLRTHRRLAQMALKRQPWNEREKAAGGIVEADPDDFREMSCCALWTVHYRFFTTNPSLYPRKIVERGWPQVENSEGVFTHQLTAEDYCFGIWGRPFDPPMVEHIGAERTGRGY